MESFILDLPSLVAYSNSIIATFIPPILQMRLSRHVEGRPIGRLRPSEAVLAGLCARGVDTVSNLSRLIRPGGHSRSVVCLPDDFTGWLFSPPAGVSSVAPQLSQSRRLFVYLKLDMFFRKA